MKSERIVWWNVMQRAVGVLVVTQCVMLWPAVMDLHGFDGIVGPAALMRLNPAAPRLGGIVELAVSIGLSEQVTINIAWAMLAISGCVMAVCGKARFATLCAWLIHLLFMGSSEASVYGFVEFLNIALFYCLFLPNGAETVNPERTKVLRNVIRCHLVIVYVSSGIHKASGTQWWTGEAVYRALSHTDLAAFDFTPMAELAPVIRIVTWGTLALELGYGLLVAFPATRRFTALATIAMHTGIAIFLNLWLFAALMILLNVSAWLLPECAQSAETGLKTTNLRR